MPLIFVVVIVVITVGGMINNILQRKRREGLLGLSQRLNLNFAPEPDYNLAERFGFLKKLAQGDNRYCYNVLSGTYQGDDVLVFDYHYQVTTHDKNGSHTTHYRFSFFILQMPVAFPDLTIRHESFFSKSRKCSTIRTSSSSPQNFQKHSASARRTKNLPTTSATRR